MPAWYLQEMGTKVLQAALALHEKVASTFRKTAVNFHYEFTVRHLANVFQGLLMSSPDIRSLSSFTLSPPHHARMTA